MEMYHCHRKAPPAPSTSPSKIFSLGLSKRQFTPLPPPPQLFSKKGPLTNSSISKPSAALKNHIHIRVPAFPVSQRRLYNDYPTFGTRWEGVVQTSLVDWVCPPRDRNICSIVILFQGPCNRKKRKTD